MSHVSLMIDLQLLGIQKSILENRLIVTVIIANPGETIHAWCRINGH